MKRSDGRRIKTMSPEYTIIPHIMKTRTGAMLFYTLELHEEIFNKYIKEKKAEGVSVSLMTILMSAFVRVMALRPAMNRFVMNGRIYARNNIQMSITMKKELSDEADEETVKFTFDGTENIYDVNDRINEEIKRLKQDSETNDTGNVAGVLGRIPNFVARIGISFLWFLDRHGMMPKAILKASPFHTSLYFTNLRSIKLDKLYHHLYDFGTTSIFISLGKSTMKPVVIDGEVVPKRVFGLGLVFDERVCDGMYFSNTLRLFDKITKDLHTLEERLESKTEDIK